MSQVEQIALRKCAEDAAIILDRFFEDSYNTAVNERDILAKCQIIPSSKKLSFKQMRSEWIYDEATAAQFVYLYAEIRERYLKNVKEYFEL